MNYIPSYGEYCRDCPCYSGRFCMLYDRKLEYGEGQRKRLDECLKDRPRIVVGNTSEDA